MKDADKTEVNHTQWLNEAQDKYLNEILWAFKRRRGTFIGKSKGLQMLIDFCKEQGINPDLIIK